MVETLTLVIITIVIALIFDFGNGLNDAANSIATVVATRVLSFRAAAFLAMFFNIIAAFFFTVAVAKTIGKGIVDPQYVNTLIILSGLIGSIFWIYLTTFLGIPVSASHSLIGGFVGSVVAAAGFKAIISAGLIKVILFIVVAPVVGMIGGTILTILVYNLFRKANPRKVDKVSRVMQLVSSSAYSLNHGANDAQKTMGLITLVLFVNGYLGKEFYVPFWVILLSHFTIGLGTLIGGWKVVKTMGMRLTKLRPIEGFCAETSGALTLFGCALFGIPVSTTHVIVGAIGGVGSVKRMSAVRWNIARGIVYAWILTIPAAAFVGAISYYGLSLFL
ncbi:inorganic phosphate transporter [Candidatus Woesearchaeota archaeon]|nr:inorganic phosphate transporter [Candidatus Woesearchaeota archaeon]